MSREAHAAMTVIEVPHNSTGSTLVVQLKADGVGVDLSSASGSKLYNAKTVDDIAIADDVAAAWYTDGTDGKVAITLTSALVGTAGRDLYMDIEIQGYSGGNLVTFMFILRVLNRAKVV